MKSKEALISNERKSYLKGIKKKKYIVLFFQIFILVVFLAIWELAATNGVVDEFITSKPSRIVNTFMNLKIKNQVSFQVV